MRTFCEFARKVDQKSTPVASNEKETEMRAALEAKNTRYRIEGPVKLPAPLPDIDFIVEDVRSSRENTNAYDLVITKEQAQSVVPCRDASLPDSFVDHRSRLHSDVNHGWLDRGVHRL
jgi:hypothetical protein